MSYNGKSKVKVLYLLKILREETNAEHGLTMPQIIQKLAEHGVSAERKSIYADLDALREFGVDVRTYRTSPVEYGIVPDEFSLEESSWSWSTRSSPAAPSPKGRRTAS